MGFCDLEKPMEEGKRKEEEEEKEGRNLVNVIIVVLK